MSESSEVASDEWAPGGLLAAFTVQAEKAAAVVHPCRSVGDVLELLASIVERGPVALSHTLRERQPELVAAIESRFTGFTPETPAEAAEAAVGVSVGEALVVETGSILVSEYHLSDRLVSMLSPVLIQVVPGRSLLRTLDEVAEFLTRAYRDAAAGYHALVTGPSRSADIERSLTIGVQGPAELHIAILSGGAGGVGPEEVGG